MEVKNINVADINQFSTRDKDYYINSKKFSQFLQYDFEYDALSEAISNRKNFPIDRSILSEVIQSQYESVNSSKTYTFQNSLFKNGEYIYNYNSTPTQLI